MSIEDVMLKLKVFSANSLSRTTRSAALFGIIAAVTGPFLLLTIGGSGASNLPWYAWMITLLLLVIGRGRYMFMLNSKEAEAISISPRRR